MYAGSVFPNAQWTIEFLKPFFQDSSSYIALTVSPRLIKCRGFNSATRLAITNVAAYNATGFLRNAKIITAVYPELFFAS